MSGMMHMVEGGGNRKKLQKTVQFILSNEDRKKFTFESPYAQEFSIPSNIIYYFARNPKFPKGHLNLISTCKSLFRLSKIIPVEYLEHDKNDNCYKWYSDGEEPINLKKLSSKLWIHGLLLFGYKLNLNLVSILIKHSYKFSLRELTLFNQVLTFGELKILVSGNKLESVNFYKNVFNNSDGSITEFEKVFELLYCKDFQFYFPDEYHGIAKNTTIKMIEILSSDHVPVEQRIHLSNIPQDFDFSLFSKFLQANMTRKLHSISLGFVDGISDAYKNQLQDFVDEIIQIRGIYAHTVPLIHFFDQNKEAFNELWKMRYETVERILKKR